MSNRIQQILVRRDNISASEAAERINTAVEELGLLIAAGELELAETICEDHFGLEPDYLPELINRL